MRKVKFLSVFVLLGLFLALGVPGAALAQEPDGDEQIPMCIDMPDAQVPGKKPGSACRVPIVLPGVSADSNIKSVGPLTLYRSGWTHRCTSESDSDLLEDRIKVEGFLYWKSDWEDPWIFEPPPCEDDNDWSYHAACRTFGGGSINKQNGYHYFQKSGYPDQSFQTQDAWTTD